jgi:hypothetical protein
MITEQEYYKLKEYYDHQRLREYNREKVYNDIKEFLDRVDKMTKEEGDENPLENSLDTMFEKAWAEMQEKDWDFPIPVGWKPKDEKLRFWNE